MRFLGTSNLIWTGRRSDVRSSRCALRLGAVPRRLLKHAADGHRHRSDGRVRRMREGASAVRGVVALTNVSTGAKYHADSKGRSGYSIEAPVGTYTVTGRGNEGLRSHRQADGTRPAGQDEPGGLLVIPIT